MGSPKAVKRKKLPLQHGSLLAILLDDGTWGMGQALQLKFFEKNKKQYVIEFEMVLFKHIRVNSPEEISGNTVSLSRENIVFIYVDCFTCFFENKVVVLPFVREDSITFEEMFQYERRKNDPNASVTNQGGPNFRLSAYFGLGDWHDYYDDPQYNAAVKINPNLRPPNAKLWVRPDPKDRKPVLCFYLYFKTAKGRNEFIKAVTPLGYELIDKIPACKDAGVTAGVVLKADLGFDSQDQYEAQLEPIAKEYGGYYDGMEQV